MYEERIVAFVDILGFKNEIERKTINPSSNDENESETERIYDFISLLNKDFVKRNTSDDSTYRVSQFSDSLVISYSVSEKASVFWILMSLLFLHLDAIYHGLLIRGAVTFGKLIHDEEHLFDPAMDEAYKMESEIANYPRIIVNPELIEIAANNPNSSNSPEHERKYIEGLLEKDFDGLLFIDYLKKGCDEIVASEDYFGLPDFINKVSEIINSNETSKDLRIIQKYNWLKNRFNDVLSYYKEKDFKKDPNYEELSDYFSSIPFYSLK